MIKIADYYTYIFEIIQNNKQANINLKFSFLSNE
jgi:hypothetical protein